MNSSDRKKALEAVQILNDLSGELVIGTNIYRHFSSEFKKIKFQNDFFLV